MGNGDIEFVSSHCAIIRCSVVVFLILFVNLVAAVTSSADDDIRGHGQHPQVDLTELKYNIIKGLKLEKLPDMAKVDISNNEFHCKYLEYFRRLYEDESEYDSGDNDDVTTIAGYDNDVSAIQVPGQVKHCDNTTGEPSAAAASSSSFGGDEIDLATITFPVDATMASGRVSVLKSVARVYGRWRKNSTAADVRVRVYGRVRSAGNDERPTLLLDRSWTVAEWWSDGGGRWTDVDVTRLFEHERRGDERRTLELTVRYRHVHGGVPVSFDGPEDDGRRPVLHAFLEGADPSVAAATVRCDGDDVSRDKRDLRDGGRSGKRRSIAATFRAGGGRKGGRGRQRNARRTDCKAATEAPASGVNGTATAVVERNKCCREQMRVVFADIPGFDFIVEPKWFDAGLCRGRCPAKYNPATRHAFIQSLLWKLHNGGGSAKNTGERPRRDRRRVRHHADIGRTKAPSPPPPPKPCCAPSKLDQLQIIHVDETDPNSLKVTTWKEMSVVECACS